MTARVLVVDDVLPNVKLLEAKLSREYFDVISAMDGPEALAKIAEEKPDIILLDVMMPGMDGFEVCQRIKSDPEIMHIPVVMVTALSETSDRVRGLEAGADDFLTKPVNDTALFARVRSLVRLKMMTDELRLREQTSNNFGVVGSIDSTDAIGGKILLVEDRDNHAQKAEEILAAEHDVTIIADASAAMEMAREGQFDLLLISLSLRDVDALRLCSQFRSLDVTRQVPQLIFVDDAPDEMERLVTGLEIGVNDYVIRPLEPNELLARVRTQVRRKRYEDQLRANYRMSMALAVTDSLTGLYNRRYLESHLEGLLERSTEDGKSATVLMLDLDHFKRINDTHGHQVGDEVLKEFADRVAKQIRGIDLAARLGGEEFVVIMPDTTLNDGVSIAERLRRAIGENEFPNSSGPPLTVTVSIGVAEAAPGGDDVKSLLKRADEALYAAKEGGRYRVVAHDKAA